MSLGTCPTKKFLSVCFDRVVFRCTFYVRRYVCGVLDESDHMTGGMLGEVLVLPLISLLTYLLGGSMQLYDLMVQVKHGFAEGLCPESSQLTERKQGPTLTAIGEHHHSRASRQ